MLTEWKSRLKTHLDILVRANWIESHKTKAYFETHIKCWTRFECLRIANKIVFLWCDPQLQKAILFLHHLHQPFLCHQLTNLGSDSGFLGSPSGSLTQTKSLVFNVFTYIVNNVNLSAIQHFAQCLSENFQFYCIKTWVVNI